MNTLKPGALRFTLEQILSTRDQAQELAEATVAQAQQVVREAQERMRQDLTKSMLNLRAEAALVSTDLETVLVHHYGPRLAVGGEALFPAYEHLSRSILAELEREPRYDVPVLLRHSIMIGDWDEPQETIPQVALAFVKAPPAGEGLFTSTVRTSVQTLHAFSQKQGQVTTAELRLAAASVEASGDLGSSQLRVHSRSDSLLLSKIEEADNPANGFSLSEYGFSNSYECKLVRPPDEHPGSNPEFYVGWNEIEKAMVSKGRGAFGIYVKNLFTLWNAAGAVPLPPDNTLARHLIETAEIEQRRQVLERRLQWHC